MRMLTVLLSLHLVTMLPGCEASQSADWALDSGIAVEQERGLSAAPIPAKGTLACGDAQVIVVNGTGQDQNCTIDYSNTCGGTTALITTIWGGNLPLPTTRNGGTSRATSLVRSGDSMTLDCCPHVNDTKKCTYEVIGCAAVPAKGPADADAREY